jgi:hypothetical protein
VIAALPSTLDELRPSSFSLFTPSPDFTTVGLLNIIVRVKTYDSIPSFAGQLPSTFIFVIPLSQ